MSSYDCISRAVTQSGLMTSFGSVRLYSGRFHLIDRKWLQMIALQGIALQGIALQGIALQGIALLRIQKDFISWYKG
jgi:hypothetical protein